MIEKIFEKIPFDYKVVGVAFFLWGVMNFTDGILYGNWLNFVKGLVAFFIAGLYYFSADKIRFLYKKKGEYK